MLGIIQGSKGCFLPYEVKEVLLKAIVQSIPLYVMSVAELPTFFCDKLTAMASRFWWRQSGKDRGVY